MDLTQGGLREDRPVAGRDYPRTWPEFQRFFADEDACVAYLERLRWPNGFRCPACAGAEGWKTKRGLWVCGSCGRQTSVTAQTIFASTRTPLSSWFAAIWQLVSAKQGMSALQLKRAMGLGSYETAWAHLHKLRRAMVRPGRELLDGLVEIDEGYVGGREEGVAGRQTADKSIVVCAVEVREGSRRELAGRVRLSRLERLSKETLEAFIADAIGRGAAVRTDGWTAYAGLPELGYRHLPINVSRTGKPAWPRCRTSTASSRCSSAGSWAPTRAPSSPTSSTTTSTSSRSASTAAALATPACSFTGSFKRPRSPSRSRSGRSWAADAGDAAPTANTTSSGRWSEADTPHICSMGADASPLPRFRRAIAARSVAQAEAAARDLGRLGDEEVLQLVLLLLGERDPRYERAAVRCVGRVLAGHPELGFEVAGDLLSGFAGLDGPAREVARSRIALALRTAGLERAADYVARGEDLRRRR